MHCPDPLGGKASKRLSPPPWKKLKNSLSELMMCLQCAILSVCFPCNTQAAGNCLPLSQLPPAERSQSQYLLWTHMHAKALAYY